MLLIGKPSINGPFSMATLNNRRVPLENYIIPHHPVIIWSDNPTSFIHIHPFKGSWNSHWLELLCVFHGVFDFLCFSPFGDVAFSSWIHFFAGLQGRWGRWRVFGKFFFHPHGPEHCNKTHAIWVKLPFLLLRFEKSHEIPWTFDG